jgi:Beta protein
MPFDFRYVPVLRSRQQELNVSDDFAFGERIVPLLEIIKEKDRVNNQRPVPEIWLGHIGDFKADRVLVDLPAYIRDTAAMPEEIIRFNRTLLSNKERRVEFFLSLVPAAERIIPVVSSLYTKTKESGTIPYQIGALRGTFSTMAIRTFTGTFDQDFPDIQEQLTDRDILLYDLDTSQPLNPLARKQLNRLSGIQGPYKVVLRSAINTEIQNVKLDHGEVIPDADNSLLDLFQSNLHMDAFGDYAGIKKDDLNAGGTISPGFIFYDPIENLYYGFKGEMKELGEFERTIVPAVLDSPIVARILAEHPSYLLPDNAGYQRLRAIRAGLESGKSQAKFKRIAMEHYLYCIRTKIQEGQLD